MGKHVVETALFYSSSLFHNATARSHKELPFVVAAFVLRKYMPPILV